MVLKIRYPIWDRKIEGKYRRKEIAILTQLFLFLQILFLQYIKLLTHSCGECIRSSKGSLCEVLLFLSITWRQYDFKFTNMEIYKLTCLNNTFHCKGFILIV